VRGGDCGLGGQVTGGSRAALEGSRAGGSWDAQRLATGRAWQSGGDYVQWAWRRGGRRHAAAAGWEGGGVRWD
ncbi:hypothetical protein COCVIDRAFT_104138, partial [Bipolaris victoriae FI3]